MNRDCFLCGHAVENVFSAMWALPGLSERVIGFSVCPRCGAVCQSPSVTEQDMLDYYRAIAVYTNPGSQGVPPARKQYAVQEQISFIQRSIGSIPESVLQVGSSDGYTLFRFREAGAARLLGIEPSSTSAEFSRQRYQIECFEGTIQDFVPNDGYELILLTHVLEHFYDPKSVLEKCRTM
ncbi:MAG: class I SAM-dependent methyltransferase, partial [Candidatus Zixiibacteriota bacterium]